MFTSSTILIQRILNQTVITRVVSERLYSLILCTFACNVVSYCIIMIYIIIIVIIQYETSGQGQNIFIISCKWRRRCLRIVRIRPKASDSHGVSNIVYWTGKRRRIFCKRNVQKEGQWVCLFFSLWLIL